MNYTKYNYFKLLGLQGQNRSCTFEPYLDNKVTGFGLTPDKDDAITCLHHMRKVIKLIKPPCNVK